MNAPIIRMVYVSVIIVLFESKPCHKKYKANVATGNKMVDLFEWVLSLVDSIV